MTATQQAELRASIVEILGLEVSPDGKPDHLLTYSDDDNTPVDGTDYSSEVNAIMALLINTDKAYGGCHLCYGKGFSTVRHGETYRGASHNERTDMKFCTCDRGKQLEANCISRSQVEEALKEMSTKDIEEPDLTIIIDQNALREVLRRRLLGKKTWPS